MVVRIAVCALHAGGRNVLGRGTLVGLVLMRVAVRQRRTGRGEPRRERESKPKQT